MIANLKFSRVCGLAILLAVCNLGVGLSAAEGPKTVFGKGNPFTLDELPTGKLKEKLLTLSPQARGKAMQWLHSFSFSAFDAEDHLRVDNGGGIFYVCPDNHGCWKGQSEKAAAKKTDCHEACSTACSGVSSSSALEDSTVATETGVERAAVPVSSPPVYSSKPGSVNTLYMDFNGGSVPNTTAWGGPAGGWNCRPWSLDADRTTFSDTEQTRIRQMWERVAEDYAPYDINVTTDVSFDPDNYGGDKNKVGWLMITPNTDANGAALPHNGSGGVAYVGAFGGGNFHSTYSPSWVLDMSPANISEATSHEFGHNLSLSHDTTSGGGGYYGGHGSNGISWGPIMGTGYGRNVSQWSQGEYYNYLNSSVGSASYYQQTDDDLAAINNFLPYRTDDHGNTNGTGTTVSPDGSGNFTETGIIERTNDPDVFHLSVGAGDITITANPYRCEADTNGGNLDINLELYNSSGGLVAANNPSDFTTASLAATVSAGDYYLYVKPSGAGTPLNNPPTGYTVYASLGQYTITGNITLAGIAVIQSGGSTDVSESGTTDTYQLALGTAPTDNVVVTVTPADSQVTVNPTSVTFTPGDWATPKTITVTAVDDALEEGDHTGTITQSASSNDPAFNNIGVGNVVAQITDNDNIILTAPNGGEKWFVTNFKTITWSSELGGNVKVELYKGGALNTVLAGSTPNDGSYEWAIPQSQAAGTDYSVRISSVEFPAREDSSDANFEIIQAIYFTDCEDDPGFTVAGEWQWGTPSGVNAATSAYSPTKMYDLNLANTSWSTAVLRSIPVDCTNYTNVNLEFYSHVHVFEFAATWEVSNDGTNWTTLFDSGTEHSSDWTLRSYDISAIADGQSTVYVRWYQYYVSDINGSGGQTQYNGAGIAIDDIKFTGTYTSPNPEIDVTRSGAVSDGATDSVTGSLTGVGSQLTYTVANTGSATLSVQNAVTSSLNNCSVVINTQPASSVAGGSSTNFVVTVTPTTAGAWSFDISMGNNDDDENPYNWTVSGTAVDPAPEMDVARGAAIADGGTDNVSGTSVGLGAQLTYSIDNTGNLDLTVQNAVVSGEGNCSVVVDTQPSSPVAGGGSTSLIVTVTPTAVGGWSFNLSVGNNDSNENPYNWTVTGTATNSVTGTFTGTDDTYINKASGGTNYGTATTLDMQDHNNQRRQALIRFDISSIPAGATVTAASLDLTAGGGQVGSVDISDVNGSWAPGTATWNNSNGIIGTTPFGSSTISNATLGTAVPTITLNAAAITEIRGWVETPSSNNGFSITSTYSSGNGANVVSLCSFDHGTAGYRPVLNVTYEAAGPSVPSVTLSTSSASIAENGGSSTITATLSAAHTSDVTVNLSYTGTATDGGTDYNASSSSILITAGNTTGSATITSVDDTIDEVNETIVIDIASVINGTESGTQQETVTITDDDSAPSVTLSANTNTIAEASGASTLTATLSNPSSQTVTVNLGYTGTASGTDYSASSNSITIAAGATTGTATVTAVQDTIDESNETVIVDITSVSNGTESGTQTETITIADDDNAPSVTLTSSTNTIAEAAGSSTLTATLSNPSSQTVTVTLAYSGTATGGGTDYTASSSTIAISAGATSGTATVTAVQDAVFEGDETIILNIASVTNGTENGTQTETITITDDDAQTFTLTVTSGTGDGDYAAGTDVAIVAAAPVAGFRFDTWTTADGGTFADATASSTTYTMPANAAEVTANYVLNNPPTANAGPDQNVNLGAGGSSPVAGAYYEWDASTDTGGDNVWNSTTANTYDWMFDSGNQTASVVSDARFDRVTGAYLFPTSKDATNTSFSGNGDQEPATFEFVIDVDGNDGSIFETGGSGDGLQVDLVGGVLRGTTQESTPARVSYTLTATDLGRFIHVVFVADMVNNVVQLYVDGDLKDSQPWTLGEDWAGTDGASLGGRSGTNPSGGSTGDYTGKMALFRYYRNKPFTAGDVTTNFESLSSTPSVTVNLDGTVGDADGDPLTTTWSVVSGPAAVTIADASAVDTTATFTVEGVYTLRLTADDTIDTAFDECIITVGSAGTPIADVGLPAGISLYGYTGASPIDTTAAFQTLIDNSELSLVRWVNPSNGAIKELYYTTFPTAGWVNEIGNMTLGQGYVVKTNVATTLSITGNKDTSSVIYNLPAGYSILGYNKETPLDARTAFQPLIDAGKLDLIRWVDPANGQIKELYYTTFPTPGWVNEIGNLTEGQGYIIKLNAAHSGFSLP